MDGRHYRGMTDLEHMVFAEVYTAELANDPDDAEGAITVGLRSVATLRSGARKVHANYRDLAALADELIAALGPK